MTYLPETSTRFWYQFLVPESGTGFRYACHGHNTLVRTKPKCAPAYYCYIWHQPTVISRVSLSSYHHVILLQSGLQNYTPLDKWHSVHAVIVRTFLVQLASW